jgi:hypothetical protein
MVYSLKCLMLFIQLLTCLNLEFRFEWPQYYAVQMIVFWLMTLCQMVSLCHFFCRNKLSLSSGCWNYIKLDTEVIREEEVGLTVLVGCRNMADYQNCGKGGGSCFGPTENMRC